MPLSVKGGTGERTKFSVRRKRRVFCAFAIDRAVFYGNKKEKLVILYKKKKIEVAGYFCSGNFLYFML